MGRRGFGNYVFPYFLNNLIGGNGFWSRTFCEKGYCDKIKKVFSNQGPLMTFLWFFNISTTLQRVQERVQWKVRNPNFKFNLFLILVNTNTKFQWNFTLGTLQICHMFVFIDKFLFKKLSKELNILVWKNIFVNFSVTIVKRQILLNARKIFIK